MAVQEPQDDKSNAGRPLKFKTVAALEKAINKYFEDCEGKWEEVLTYEPVYEDRGKQKRDGNKLVYDEVIKKVYRPSVVPTISGLAVALNTTRRTLLDYEAKDKFSHTIKRAKQTIEAMTESLLVNGGAIPAGVIFNLKNNWGWKDQTQTDLTTDGDKIEFINTVPRPNESQSS